MNKLSTAGMFLAATVLVGCGGGQVYHDVEVDSVEGIAGHVNVTGLGDEATASGLDDLQADSGALSLAQQTLYFAYDSSMLTAASQELVRAHARYLIDAGGVQVILEGHADERGTREYNLALAEGRAKAVANALQALGVHSGRIQTVSYGEERPVALGHDESAWRLNRRVEILY